MAFADLEDELAELDVGSNSQECQLALFEDESEESAKEKEGEIDDSDDKGYKQDSGADINDELEEAFPASKSESGSERYTLSYEVDAEEPRVEISELVDPDTYEHEEGYDADDDFEHIAIRTRFPVTTLSRGDLHNSSPSRLVKPQNNYFRKPPNLLMMTGLKENFVTHRKTKPRDRNILPPAWDPPSWYPKTFFILPLSPFLSILGQIPRVSIGYTGVSDDDAIASVTRMRMCD